VWYENRAKASLSRLAFVVGRALWRVENFENFSTGNGGISPQLVENSVDICPLLGKNARKIRVFWGFSRVKSNFGDVD
jgi:hypothetical protein